MVIRVLLTLALGLSLAMCPAATVHAETILGTGTESLRGGDLTDPENDGEADEDVGYNAVFSSSEEEGFGGGESAFNVFDNLLGGGNDKWCCGSAPGIGEDGIWIDAQLTEPYFLTAFTVSSANDVAGRDPIHWAVQGSNDGETYSTIFEHDGDSLWNERLQVILFTAGDDFETPEDAFQIYRHVTFNTANNPNGAFFQLGEIEYFGETTGRTDGDFNGDGVVDLADFSILTENFNESFSFDVSYANGDATGDGTVDLKDFFSFRETFNGAAGAAAASVPEPTSLALLATGGLGLLFRRRR